MENKLQAALKYANGTDHPMVGSVIPCSIRAGLFDQTIDIKILAVRNRFMTIALYVTPDYSQIGIAFETKTGYRSQSSIPLPADGADCDLSLILTQLGFTTDGD